MNTIKFISLCLSFNLLIIACNTKEQKTSEQKDVNKSKDDYVILDSLKINDRESLYCFNCMDFLSGGEKVYISLSSSVCNISKDKVLAVGNSIGGFSDRTNNTIYLYGYDKPEIIDYFSRFSFEIRDLSDDKILIAYRKRNFKRIVQDELCH